jgi:hypothetical protein
MDRRRPGNQDAPEPRCPFVEIPDNIELGPHWALIKGLDLSGSPGVTSAAVGEQGTVLIAAVGAVGSLTARAGQLYCGEVCLEPAIGELAAARRALADDLPPAMADGATSVHALLIVPDAPVTFTHRDVIVTSAGQAANALFSLPAVHAPDEVRWAKSVLRDRTGQTSPPAFSDEAVTPIQLAPRGRGGVLGRSRRGRLRAGPLLWLVTAAIFVAVVSVVLGQLYSGSGSAPPPAPLASAATGSAATTGVPVHVGAVAYQGQQPGDVVATSTGVAEIAGVRVTLGDPVVVPSLTGPMLLCVAVSVENRGAMAAVTGAVTWALHSPTGAVEHPASMATNQVLSQGHLFPGQYVTGKVCFKHPGQGGVYVITFSPHPKSTARSRGVWLVHLARAPRPH